MPADNEAGGSIETGSESEKIMKAANQRVMDVLEASGFGFEIIILPTAVRTARLAAEALGCAVGQIANSLIFRDRDSGDAVLIMCAGDRRVDAQKVARQTGIALARADADFVREATGFAIGGVPPVAHSSPVRCLLDVSLRRHEVVWAAAGTPESVFRLTPDELEKITGGDWLELAQD